LDTEKIEMINNLVTNEKEFRDYVIRQLHSAESDFVKRMSYIRERKKTGEAWSISGVLILLEFDTEAGEYSIILNKRSPYVQQPGDLCCPGGRIGNGIDTIFGYLLSKNIISLIRPGSFKCLQHIPNPEKDIIGKILAGVLRECWEEMRLPPWKVEYLGGIPSHRMQSFPRIIFPLVGRIIGRWNAKPNWEVEKIFRVPIRSFFDPSNYALYSPRVPSSYKDRPGTEWFEIPSLVVQEGDDEEILWGATFGIMISFMQLITDLSLDMIHPQRKIQRDLPADYFTGKPRPAHKS
jgi:hypothetical protein